MKDFVRRLLISAICMAGTLSARAQGPDRVGFNEHIRPILSDTCFACHGQDAKQRQADLRLDVPEGAYADRDGQVAITPGDLSQSAVWKRITSDDPDFMMPPPSSNKTLTDEQKQLIRRWIEQGAVYQKHWAFERPVAAEPPPSVQNGASVRNEVDRFLQQRLEREGLAPQPDADRETLIRRVSFALTGLPPTVREVDAFLDDAAPDAYERMVERYLESDHFGEEMARHWLDVARYADTHGLHLDNERQMWAYRDWVVRAFNVNLPFDQFTVWQLAGDLLADEMRNAERGTRNEGEAAASPFRTPHSALRIPEDLLVATGFNRCNVTTSEGGSIAPEFLYRYAVDRTSTMVQTWMGLTGGCAVCHDHKYDPLSTKEFYSLYAFFYSAGDPAMDGNINVTAPFLKLPEDGEQAALDAATANENDARRRLEEAAVAAEYHDPADQDPAPAPLVVRDVLIDEAFPLGATTRNTSRNAADWVTDPDFGAKSGRRVLRQANPHFHQDIVQNLLQAVTVPADARFEVWVRPDPRHPPRAVAVEFGNRRAVWGDPEAFAEEQRKEPIVVGDLPPAGVWTKVAFTAESVGLKEGQPLNNLALQEAGGVAYWDEFAVAGTVEPAKDPQQSLGAWRKAHKGKSPADVPGELQSVLKEGPEKEVTDELLAKLRRFYLAYVARPVNADLAERRRAWEEARAARMIADEAIAGTFIYRDEAQPREAFVMLRGQYDKPGESVKPGVPAVLPPLKVERNSFRSNGEADGSDERNEFRSTFRPTRLDLARWLVAPEHPLTARVAVNRFWQQFFGTGLVRTSGDFGTRGELPSHPELLDWLAVRFQESGWDVKALVRLMVTSSAFRRDSRFTSAGWTSNSAERVDDSAESRSATLGRIGNPSYVVDPDNRLYARGPRFRLDAEQIRDNALFVSGLINLQQGGRGALTYQPPNIWEPVGYSDSNTRYYLQDHGATLYRRSLYCFLKRTAPPPFMSNFDGPNREQPCSRRERSNTPLQALQLMNDVQHFEAARALAERTLTDGGGTTESRIEYLYRTVLARRPDAQERLLMSDALDVQRRLFEADPEGAGRAIRVGESPPRNVAPAPETAAWTLLANLVLNLDETVTRN
jgi:hypothetical protein